jgi:hypothetical protein
MHTAGLGRHMLWLAGLRELAAKCLVKDPTKRGVLDGQPLDPGCHMFCTFRPCASWWPSAW